MKRLVGLWVDHDKAVCVTLDGESYTTETIESGVEGHFRLSGGWRTRSPYGPQAIVSEQRPDERRRHQLHSYYRKLVAALRGADAIYIIGPGEAPHELQKEIAKLKGMASKVAAVERADKMTTRQIAARVKRFFKAPPLRGRYPA
ncbi:MAG TPA: hypothetical protein VMT60_00265 [Candidatus Bathyarchaeia archaeon]|nr:hypothetical protein [Candidatus Bathyarchaeia archaeon]